MFRCKSVIPKVSNFLKLCQKNGYACKAKKDGGLQVKSECKPNQDKPKTPPRPPSKAHKPYSYAMDKCDMYPHHKSNSKKWKSISLLAVAFALGLTALVIATSGHHIEPEFIPYEFMYRRTKRFPWRDGRTSLFHGPSNLIPDEEEERITNEQQEGAKGPKYKTRVNEEEDKLKRREQHAEEEFERRKLRRAQEASA